MASKRKKKQKASESMERYKPSLMFVESPVAGPKHYNTPVQAARNPYMAPSIPVEELSNEWVLPQFPENEDSPVLKKRRKKRCKQDAKPTDDKEKFRIKIPMLPLDFEEKVRGAREETPTRTTLRHSVRLKEKSSKQEHFLFEENHLLTPKLAGMAVLVCETPDDGLFPVVLRRLRETRGKDVTSRRMKK